MSYELILPFFPGELRTLLLDPPISDLMINGTTGVYADRGGVIEQIALSEPYTNDRLQAAIERIARILGQDLTSQNPILNTRLPGGSRVASTIRNFSAGEYSRRTRLTATASPASLTGPSSSHILSQSMRPGDDAYPKAAP